MITWSPRPARGLFFDRFEHARPQVVIPFDTEGDGAVTGDAARRYKEIAGLNSRRRASGCASTTAPAGAAAQQLD